MRPHFCIVLHDTYVSGEHIKIIYVSIEHGTLGSDKIIAKDRPISICVSADRDSTTGYVGGECDVIPNIVQIVLGLTLE